MWQTHASEKGDNIMGDGMSDGSYCSSCDERKSSCVCEKRRVEEERRVAHEADVVINNYRDVFRELEEATHELERARTSIRPAQERYDEARRIAEKVAQVGRYRTKP